jgi:hypothetical protein
MHITTEEKVLFLIFITEYSNNDTDYWVKCVKTFDNLAVSWWVEPEGASHLGLAKQSILNTNSIEEAEHIAKYIEAQFEEPVLICLSKQLVSNVEPVGLSTDECWVEFGRTFDQMVSDKQRGIFIL